MYRAEKQASERSPPEQPVDSDGEFPPSNVQRNGISLFGKRKARKKIHTETWELSTDVEIETGLE
jgi:hypothetical protein